MSALALWAKPATLQGVGLISISFFMHLRLVRFYLKEKKYKKKLFEKLLQKAALELA